MTRYLRRRPKAGDTVASAVASLAVGAVAAAATFYVVRLFLAREPLGPPALPASASGAGGRKGERALPGGSDRPAGEGGIRGPN